MLKASALYLVIIIALVIAVLCSSLIVAAYFYRFQYQRTFRHELLQNNLSSGVNLLVASSGDGFSTEKTISLFGDGTDSVSLKKIQWGIFDIGVSKAFAQQDTLYKTFLMANTIDSSKWAALYVIDEDRPLSVSGKTMIKGDAYIAKAGIKEAYVDNKAYQGTKPLIQGKIANSEKKLPRLNQDRLDQLEKVFIQTGSINTDVLKSDSINNSFLKETHLINLGRNPETLSNIKLCGNIILVSDSIITIENTTKLENVVIFAKSIVVKNGFHGTCQIFATDSIAIERDCVFDYPSCIGVTRFKEVSIGVPPLIHIGENTKITGLVFTYDKYHDRNKQPIIDLGKNVIISGQVYSDGLLGLKDEVEINGSLFTNRFLYQSTFTRYENYIINTQINSKALSPYFLNSDLMPTTTKTKKVLQWIETN